MIGFVCKYTPVELLEAAGARCARLDPAPAGFDCADACAHQNLCGFGKAVLESVLTEGITELVVTDCCDVMRRVYDVLAASGRMKFLYLLPLPHKTGEAEVRLFAGELRRLLEAWQAYGGGTLSRPDALARWRAASNAAQAEEDDAAPKLELAGAHGGSLLKKLAAERFSLPLRDDTCTGLRHLALPPAQEPEEEDAFLTTYARALLRQGRPCMRMWDNAGREAPPGTAGVLYHTVKFCDYYGFEYLNRKQREKVPLLKIETDCTPQSQGQLGTRLDAFAETIGAVAEKASPLAGERDGRYVAGVDSGSTSTDAVILDRGGRICGRAILPTGAGAAAGAERALEQALRDAGAERDELAAVVTTGYGRKTVGLGDSSVTEITCHARGAHYLDPAVRTVIDIGGQDSKVIRVDGTGAVVNFVMNDKCAAGTGRFLDMMARTLELTLPEMSELGLHWSRPVNISSMCTVFAESEVVSLVAENTPAADVIHGLNQAVAAKTVSLARRLGGEPAYMMTGGVAQNRGVVAALEEKLGAPVTVSPEAQLCGAIGAALLGLEALETG